MHISSNFNYCDKTNMTNYNNIINFKTWIHYDNPKHRAAWVKPSESGTLTLKQIIHSSKVMMCIWQDHNYELLWENTVWRMIEFRSSSHIDFGV